MGALNHTSEKPGFAIGYAKYVSSQRGRDFTRLLTDAQIREVQNNARNRLLSRNSVNRFEKLLEKIPALKGFVIAHSSDLPKEYAEVNGLNLPMGGGLDFKISENRIVSLNSHRLESPERPLQLVQQALQRIVLGLPEDYKPNTLTQFFGLTMFKNESGAVFAIIPYHMYRGQNEPREGVLVISFSPQADNAAAAVAAMLNRLGVENVQYALATKPQGQKNHVRDQLKRAQEMIQGYNTEFAELKEQLETTKRELSIEQGVSKLGAKRIAELAAEINELNRSLRETESLVQDARREQATAVGERDEARGIAKQKSAEAATLREGFSTLVTAIEQALTKGIFGVKKAIRKALSEYREKTAGQQ